MQLKAIGLFEKSTLDDKKRIFPKLGIAKNYDLWKDQNEELTQETKEFIENTEKKGVISSSLKRQIT